MRDLLRKPLPVLIMALAAIWVVYSNVIQPMQKKSLLRAPAMSVQPLAEVNTPQSTSFKEALKWNHTYARDPFSPYKVIRKVSKKQKQQRFVLSAILFGTKEPLAMINGELLSQGDKILNQTVLSIQQDFVILKGEKGQKKLTLSQHPRG